MARRSPSSFAGRSSGVTNGRSLSASNTAISISRSIVLLRLTSVGCAVKTGTKSTSKKITNTSRSYSGLTRAGERACN
jgi:hypothetical protein